MQIDDEKFQSLIDQALGELPGEHVRNIKNVAILFEDEPTAEQRVKFNLDSHHTLLGLYEGIPLSKRQGLTPTLPDRITLFKLPLVSQSVNENDLRENIRHTLWHEIAHYYGLDHDGIGKLDKK